jgi:hypothetical protein
MEPTPRSGPGPTVALSSPRLRPVVLVLALLMPVGPAAVGVLRYVLPYYGADGNPEVVAAAARRPDAESAVLWLGCVAVLTLVPGLIAAARLCREAAPVLTGWALGLAVPGYLSLGALLYSDQVLWSATRAGIGPAATVRLLDAAHPTVDIGAGVFVLGHVVGTVLLGVALLRSGRIPAWAAWMLVVSQPLHFVTTVFLGSPTIDLLAWSMTAVAMAVVGGVLVSEGRPSRSGADSEGDLRARPVSAEPAAS